MDWPLEIKKMIISKAYDALHNGGIIIICDEIVDDQRRNRELSLLTSMFM
jgi:hypothetical protein